MKVTRGEWNGSDEERNQLIWQDYCSGWKQWQIAKAWKLSQARVSQIITSVRASLPERKREDLIAQEMDFLRKVRKRALDLTEKMPAPVTAGKDGALVIDPETREVVRDYSGHIKGFQLALEAHTRFVRMLGLDQPQQINVSVTAAEEAAASQAAAEAVARMMEDNE